MNINTVFRLSNDNNLVNVSIKKLSIKEGHTSLVGPGEEFNGTLWDTRHGGLLVRGEDMYSGGNTSKVTKIISKTDSTVIFETSTSVYQLIYK